MRTKLGAEVETRLLVSKWKQKQESLFAKRKHRTRKKGARYEIIANCFHWSVNGLCLFLFIMDEIRIREDNFLEISINQGGFVGGWMWAV